MESLTIEFQRFGDPAGIVRLSDRYIRIPGTQEPVSEVGFALAQENFDKGMATLDYGNFAGSAERREGVLQTADWFLEDIKKPLVDFLFETPLDAGAGLKQVEIVTRAQELSQLPFEALEEFHEDLVITRRIRQPWPLPEVARDNTPRVLFIWAEPAKRPGSSRRMTVPFERHRKLLQTVLAPWGREALVEVKHATRSRIADKLARGARFTHVHLLAHGIAGKLRSPEPGERIELDSPPDPVTYLALERPDGNLDRCPPDALGELFSAATRPETFVVATCHSAEIDPTRSGATLAHVLHGNGVPIVLASQLALTKEGADCLIDPFLKRVIGGTDPREALRECRDAMRNRKDQAFYDRVALVGYVHMDAEAEQRLRERHFAVALKRLQATSKEANLKVAALLENLGSFDGLEAAHRVLADEIRSKFEEVRTELVSHDDEESLTKAQLEELRGLQASSLKREAEAAWKLARALPDEAATEWRKLSHVRLRDAADAYRRAATISRDHHWTWVQWLALEVVENGSLDGHEDDWVTASAAARDALDTDGRVWGLGSLCELYLLSQTLGTDRVDDARQCLERLAEACAELGQTFPIDSTLSQLERYVSWWNADDFSTPNSVVQQARELHSHLRNIAKKTEEANMFKVEMLPANEGDALWIEFGTNPVRRILIDCGRKTAYREVARRLEASPELGFELFVLTHVDADHIAGAVPLLQDSRFGPERVKEVWFNGWRHLNGKDSDFEGDAPDTLSARQGEFFAAVLRDQGYSWNTHFDKKAVMVEDDGELPVIELDGGMRLTILGPNQEKLDAMRERWKDDLEDTGIGPGDFEKALELLGEDRTHLPDVLSGGHVGPIVVEELVNVAFDPDGSEPNGSSICFLAEFGGKAVLFAGDAHAPQLVESVRRLLVARGLERLPLDALKMAHHGSARNNSFELLELLDCRRYLISTNGSTHHHPDPEALARVLDVQDDGVEFHFNYRSDESELWDNDDLRAKHGYQSFYPESGDGLLVEI
ncbi:MAG: CHAT domain-containing protein [Pseudomonadota bacterium]